MAEKKYIGVEEAIEYCTEHIDGNIGLIASNAIQGVSPADVVEVVRCKDCIHYSNNKGNPELRNGYCDRTIACFDKRNSYDYCSYGVRKAGEDKVIGYDKETVDFLDQTVRESVDVNKPAAETDYKWWVQQIKKKFPEANEAVLNFIGEATSYVGAEDFFTNGYCYYFAKMLEENFGGEVMWHFDHNHIAWKDENGVAYDAHGVFEDYGEYEFVPVACLGKCLTSFKHTDVQLTSEDFKEAERNGQKWIEKEKTKSNHINAYEKKLN